MEVFEWTTKPRLEWGNFHPVEGANGPRGSGNGLGGIILRNCEWALCQGEEGFGGEGSTERKIT